MLRERGNTSSTRKLVLDPKISYEIGKVKQLIPRITYGTTFPQNAKVGDLHYYQGESDGTYVHNNYYVAKPNGDGWQSTNADLVNGANISGAIPSGVTIKDYLSLFGGTMEGLITFFKNQILPAEMIKGRIPKGVVIEDYLSIYGGILQGLLNMTGHNISRVGTVTGYDTALSIDMGTDGEITITADTELTLTSTLLTLVGLSQLVGDVTISGDLQVNGQQIGISTDTDLLTLAANLLTITGDATVTGEIKAATAKLGDVSGGNYSTFDSTGTITLNGTAGIVIPHMMQSDSTDQAIADITTDQVITFDTDVHHNGITRTSSSRFTIAKAGSYLITFSGITMGVINEYIAVWLKVNGNNVANSNTLYQYKSNNTTTVVAVAFIVHFAVNDYFEFWTWGSNVGNKWDATAAVAANPGVTPARPASPSIIITCNYVGKD